MRAALRVAAVLALLLLTVHPVTAAEPTLGARISPVEILYEEGDALSVTNRSTIPVVAALSASDGWTLGTASLVLAVDEEAIVPILSAGPDGATIRVTLTPSPPIAGTDAAALVLETRARHLSPWERVPGWAVGLAVLMAAVTSAWLLRRLRRQRYASGWSS